MHAFYAAGFIVLEHAEQSRRAHGRKRKMDRLGEWLDAYLAECPEATTQEIIRAIHRAVQSESFLADSDGDTLTYQPSYTSEDLEDISAPALERRIQRMRRRQ